MIDLWNQIIEVDEKEKNVQRVVQIIEMITYLCIKNCVILVSQILVRINQFFLNFILLILITYDNNIMLYVSINIDVPSIK